MVKLDIKILSGNRRGNLITLTPVISSEMAAEKVVINNNYVLEHEPLELIISSDSELNDIKILLDEIEIRCNFQNHSDGIYEYIWRPNPYRNGLECLFHNYFGIAQFAIVYNTNSVEKISIFDPIEVLGRKITAERSMNMIEFIANEVDEHIAAEISPTSMHADQVSSGCTPGKLLEMISTTISQTEQIGINILKNPITKLKPSIEVRKSNDTDLLDDQTIGWLFDNLSILEAVDHPDSAHFDHLGDWYSAREIQLQNSRESTDIYENQIIHLFLNHLSNSLNSLLNGFNNIDTNAPVSITPPKGYESFFRLKKNKSAHTQILFQNRAHECKRRLSILISAFKKIVPVSNTRVHSIDVTEKIKMNSHYLSLMAIMKNWFTDTDIDWRKHKILSSIHNAPKLFELYSCLALNKVLNSLGQQSINSKGLFKGHYRGNYIQLQYEPAFYNPISPSSQVNSIVNTDLQSVKKAMLNISSKHELARYNRRPDFVITIKNNSSNSLIVLDAKYTNFKNAHERDLPSCVMKYVHGIHDKAGKSIVESMVILFPYDSEKIESPNFIDYHALQFGLKGNSTVFPVLGCQEISLTPQGKENSLEKTISILMDKIINAFPKTDIEVEQKSIPFPLRA